MVKNKLFFVALTILLSSCGLAIHLVSSGDTSEEELDTEGKTNIHSPYNENNLIYKTNRVFVYEVNQTFRNRHLRFLLDLVVIPGSFNRNETRIKYKYHYNPEDLNAMELKEFGFDGYGNYANEFTSLMEEKNDIRFHPPRSKTLVCLEAAPFPGLPYKLKKGMRVKEFLYIPKGSWGKLGGSKITWRYEVDSVQYNQDSTSYFCRVNATADSKKGGHNTLLLDFKSDSGFTRLSYRFQDSTTIEFLLKEIK